MCKNLMVIKLMVDLILSLFVIAKLILHEFKDHQALTYLIR